MSEEFKNDSSQNEIFYLETENDELSSKTKSTEQSEKCNKSSDFTVNKISITNQESTTEENKRTKPMISPSSPSSMAAFGITPPNFVSFDEIMKTANEMTRLALVNEIVLNNDFKLEKKEDSKLKAAIKENMIKAFWDILEEQLAEQPPNYNQAISLIGEIKETLLLFLMPQHVQLKNEIDNILDIDLIKQKLENGIVEFQRYGKYILSVCARLCCPARDEMIQKLTSINEMIPLYKGIFELLELMRMDFANFYITHFRPHIQLVSVQYERDKFKELIETHQKYNIDALEFTFKWIEKNYQCLDLTQETNVKQLFNKALISSYMDLLKCLNPSFNCYLMNTADNKEQLEDDYPETLLLIRHRIEPVREKVYKVTFISSVFVVTFAAIGEPLQSIKDFRLKLKNHLDIIINPNDTSTKDSKLLNLKQEDLQSILTSTALQVISSIEQAVKEYDVTAKVLDKEKLDSLKYQINELANPGNRIRCVMERRILEFIERVITSPPSQTAAPIQVPKGLSTFSNELINIASEFTRLVAYNRAVYSPYYTKILAKIAKPTHFIPNTELEIIEKSFYD